MSFSGYVNPRLYFQSGDGTELSPKGVEPVSSILFLLWLMGLYYFLSKKQFKHIFISLGFALIAFVIGKRSMAFLFPVLLSYVYFSWVGYEYLVQKKHKRLVLKTIFMYGLFIVSRSIWIN
jgi:hypothetical protein